MIRELLSTWGDYQVAIDRVLAATERTLYIFDLDLEHLKLESPARIEQLQRVLLCAEPGGVRIAVRSAAKIKTHAPRLLHLLELHGHVMSIVETSDNIAHVRDSMVIADSRHGVIRFDQDQPRCKLVTEDEAEIQPYVMRFEEIWLEGQTPVSPNTLGL